MPISMTRKEYELKYGFAPVLPPVSNVDTTPSPRRMTRAEYEAEFGTPETPKEGFFTKAGNAINEFNPFYQIPKMAIEGASKLGTGLGEILDSKSPSEVIRPTVSALAGGTQMALAIPFGLFESAINLPGVKQVKNFLWGTEPGKVTLPNIIAGVVPGIKGTGDIKPLQELVTKYQDSPEIAGDLITLILGLYGVKELKTPELKPNIQVEFQRAYDKAIKIPIVKATKNKIETARANADIKAKAREVAYNAEITQEVADEIANIESQYSKLRKANAYSKDANASRLRIAEADVLPGSVDSTGMINSKLAVDEYYKKTLEGKEAVVRENLAYLGETVTPKQIERDLTLEINRSGLEGGDLITALNGIKREIQGLKLRADKNGNIPLESVHDAKISTTRNIDYNTPPETKTYRKANARAYKKIVEDNSSFNVKEVNTELAKYYEDITRLENLNGRKVKGGKLGKYFAQISGNIVGGAVGSAVGGTIGMAAGTVIGGEVASGLRGEQMASTFGEPRGLEIPKNPILERARLSVPDKVIKAVKGIPKTKEITQIEKDIKKNVAQQEKAIKANDFTLVAKLKEIYAILVDKLKELIKRYKDTPNKEGGFIKNSTVPPSTSDITQTSAQKSLLQSSDKSSIPTKKSQGYKETGNLTTKILKDLEGRTTVSRQYILDATNRGELKQVERDLTREVLSTMEGDTINVQEFADKVNIAEFSKKEFRYTNSIEPNATIGELPISRFDGKDISSSQNTVDKKGVNAWKKKIQAGERPYILIEYSERLKTNKVIDGHTRLTAYKQLGFEKVPVIDNTNKILKSKTKVTSLINSE